MKPTNDKLTQQPAPEQPQGPPKKKRFRLVRLEERIAPKSANATNNGPGLTHRCGFW
jgi:hypothetical protein